MANDKAIFDDSDCDSSAPDRALLDSRPSCLNCGEVQRVMKCCTRCHSAFYCSKTCFAKHWSVHKKSCHPQSSACQRLQRQSGTTESGEGSKTVYKVIQHKKPAVKPVINFQKAADALTATTTTPKPEVKPQQSQNASDPARPETPQVDHDANLPGVEIILRYNKQKHKFKVCDSWDPPTIFSKMSTSLSCLADNMRVIHKGKQLGADTVRSAVGPGAVFQVLGEPMEDASGLVPKDIEVLMLQMGVERNAAVRALKQAGGDLIDAMMAIGNK